MNEETEALAYSQLLLLHADTITDSGVKEMVVNSAAELTILHLRVEALRLENERLRGLVRHILGDRITPEAYLLFGKAWVDEAHAALRRERT